MMTARLFVFALVGWLAFAPGVTLAASPRAFAVVPFAVPVAVPVATLAAPTVLYSYRDQAAYQAAPAQRSGPLAGTVTTIPSLPPRAPGPSVSNLAPASGPAGEPAESALSIDARARALLVARCAACHAAGDARGGLTLAERGADGGLVTLERLPRFDLLVECEAGRMPQGGPALEAAELELLKEWFLLGAVSAIRDGAF